VRLPYNVNVLTQLVTIEVLRDPNVLEAQAAAIRAERARVLTELRRLPGVEAYASDANFIMFRAARADQLFNGLKLRGVLIKNLNGTHPLLVDCLRATVGTPDENAQFLGALSALLNP
jgi:histidinol-phosphate aminotransferase